ncbi:OmpA family protein [Flavobacterium degerlachei]|jgi:outer membrane protein OmpA-like peptidoglycan-associated protein/tetratricopeptide (TPR) repeat protein|uniref:WD40-like Beta Propeller Repeat n=1 Tax=Flavobacterium degerlachei TaxID=229203 RepID=A0A1H3G5L7_9FLAO|nr:OmpA family protein [Flavobacterium degerlachei]SDX97978.1 WD40-like Beta Propeller Repeat [Flavobacterium degerlachei]
MKKYTTILFFVLSSMTILAQNKQTKSADKLFDRYEYVKAASAYEVLVQNGNSDSYVFKQLGKSYYYMNNTSQSEKWYEQAMQTEQDADTHYRYAQLLKSNGKYADSDKQMKVFVSMKPNDPRAKEFINNPDYLSKISSIEKLFDLKKLNINSTKSDFGAIQYNEILYFTSSRNESRKIYGLNNEPFLDLYQSNYTTKDATYSEPTPVSELNSIYHEGPLTMTADGKTVYFSSESFNEKLFQKNKKKNIKSGQVNLYKATNDNGKWVNITPLPFNSKDYSVSNPSLSIDGKTLYFSSNMPGTIGGLDIWKVAVNGDGSFGNAENLGSKVNTSQDESFPFVSEEEVLYFSSKGLTGLGGYDIFSIDLNKNESASNLGKPVNSEKDDFAFTFDKKNKLGYISSNREGKDEIYSSVAVISNGQINAVVSNSVTGVPLVNARVVISDIDKKIVEKLLTNVDGAVSYSAKNDKTYLVEISKDGFVSKSFPITVSNGAEFSVDAKLDPINVVVTDTEFIFNPVYFEFDKSDITKGGAAELDKLIYIMSQNEDLVIYVKSHTDSRGNDKYNLKLSERRAIATVEYIISKGISKDKISGKGFGESEPIIDCHEDCSEDKHALNRRSEFIIRNK